MGAPQTSYRSQRSADHSPAQAAVVYWRAHVMTVGWTLTTKAVKCYQWNLELDALRDSGLVASAAWRGPLARNFDWLSHYCWLLALSKCSLSLVTYPVVTTYFAARSSPEWPKLCRVRRYLAQAINCCMINHWLWWVAVHTVCLIAVYSYQKHLCWQQ